MTEYVPPTPEIAELVGRIASDVDGHERVLVAGGPRAGKSTLSEVISTKLGVKVRHTDDTIDRGWSNASAEVSTWFDDKGRQVIEGVAVPRALRKWLAANPEGKPCDVIYWSNAAKVGRTFGQETMGKGCQTVWDQILAELQARGVEIRKF